MRVPVEYVALAISGLGYSSSGAPSLKVSTFAAPASSCWTTSTGVSANWGPISDLRLDATAFCNQFSTNNTAIVSSSGKYVFGYQSAIFVGYFASWTSCINTFNTLVTDCYGTTNGGHPNTLGGSIVDPGGANLVISFGDGAQL